jgi:PAS domain-containing protein
MGRWARHIADPSNVETYIFLSQHSRRGFIAQFPASRFLAAQMRFIQLLVGGRSRRVRRDPAHADELTAAAPGVPGARPPHHRLLRPGTEEEILEQEASYRRGIDRAPACILMVDAAAGTIFDANHVAERLLGYSREELDGRPLEDLHPRLERQPSGRALASRARAGPREPRRPAT